MITDLARRTVISGIEDAIRVLESGQSKKYGWISISRGLVRGQVRIGRDVVRIADEEFFVTDRDDAIIRYRSLIPAVRDGMLDDAIALASPNSIKPKRDFGARPVSTLLSNDDVMMMRQQVHETGEANLRGWGRHFGVSHATIHSALRGRTFRDLPDPVTEAVLRQPRGGAKYKISEEFIRELYDLRASRPSLWTYKMLAQKANVKLKTHYGPSNIKRMFDERWDAVVRPEDAKPNWKVKPVPPGRKKVVAPPPVTLPVLPPPVIRPALPAHLRVVDVSSAEARRAVAARILAMRNR